MTALRGIRRQPLLTLTILITLTVGLGMSTGVFTLIRALMARTAWREIAKSVRLVGLREMKPRRLQDMRLVSIVACGMSMSTEPTG